MESKQQYSGIYKQWLRDNARTDSDDSRKDWDNLIKRNEDMVVTKFIEIPGTCMQQHDEYQD